MWYIAVYWGCVSWDVMRGVAVWCIALGCAGLRCVAACWSMLVCRCVLCYSMWRYVAVCGGMTCDVASYYVAL